MNAIAAVFVILLSTTIAWADPVNVQITPGTIDFGIVGKGQVAHRSFTITNPISFSPLIATATISSAYVKFGRILDPTQGFEIPAGGTRSINLELAATAPTGQLNATLQMTFKLKSINAASTDTFVPKTVPISASIVGVSFSPASLDFGLVPLGQNKTLNASIKNEGPVQVSCTMPQLATDAPAVSVSPGAPLILSPGQLLSLATTFSPTNLNQTAGRIVFNCGFNPNPVLALQGKANAFSVAARCSGSFVVSTPLTVQVTNVAPGGNAIQCGSSSGGSFGSSSTPTFVCQGPVVGGAVIKLTASPQKFLKWTQGTGSATVCNNKTSNECTFTVSSDSSLVALYE